MKKVIALTSFFVAVSCGAAEPPAAPPSPLFIMLKAASCPQAFSSVSFSVRSDNTRMDFDKDLNKRPESKWRSEGRVYISNNKYFSESRVWNDLNSPTPDDGNISAYDGKRYQFLNRKRSTMVLYNTLPISGYNMIGSPLLQPLGFLFYPFSSLPAT